MMDLGQTGCCTPHYFGRPSVISVSKYREEVVDLLVDWYPEAGPSGYVATSAWDVRGPGSGLTLFNSAVTSGQVASVQAAVGTAGSVYVLYNSVSLQSGPTGAAHPEVLLQQFQVYVRPSPEGVDGAVGPCCPTGPCGCGP